MIRRFMNALVESQQGWADPFGEWSQKVLHAIWGPIRFLKDFLHGTWLGHALHPALTDIPIGAFIGAFVLDVWTMGCASCTGIRTASDVVIAVGLLGMLGAIATGLADYTDTDTKPARGYATLHGLLMLLAFVLYAISLWIRANQPAAAERTVPVWLAIVGLGIIVFSSYLGGDLVYLMGNMVGRHAFRSFGTKWVPLDVTAFAENAPTKVRAGAQSLVVVRRGEQLFALHDVCAHAGCNLSEGTVVGDAIECGCHGSRFRLADGHVVGGPSTFDQPRYEVRSAEGKVEVRHAQ